MEYNEAKKTLEDLGIDPVEAGKTGEKIASEIMDKAKAMSQNESISHVVDCKHENEKMHQGDGFVYVTCADCGEDL